MDDNVLKLKLENKQMKDKYLKMNMHVSNYDVNNYRVKIFLMEKLLNVVVVVNHYDKGREGRFWEWNLFEIYISPTSDQIILFLVLFFEMLK